MTLKPKKCEIAFTRTYFLGHTIGDGKCECQKKKIQKICMAPRPILYADCSPTIQPPEERLQHQVGVGCRTGEILHYTKRNTMSFSLRMDASGEAVGTLLLQEFDGRLFFVAYHSRTLSKAECNFSNKNKTC